MENYGTYFEDGAGRKLAELDGVLALSLHEEMRIFIHGHGNKEFRVTDWYFRVDHADGEPGLHISVED